MIGTSRAEYLFIRICIFGLHYLAPFCIFYSVYAVVVHGSKSVLFRLPFVVEVYAAAESLFFLLIYLPYHYYLQRDAVHPPAPSKREREVLFNLCTDNVTEPEMYFRKWFEGANISDIKKENVKEWYAWAFFNRGGPPGDDDVELEEYVSASEKLLERPFEAGRGKAKALRLTLDRVHMLHRSLIWYSIIAMIDTITFVTLRYHGFRFYRTPLSQFFRLFPLRGHTLLTAYRSPAKYTSYWYRPHTSSTKLPVIFIHGIGIGLHPYTGFLSELNSTSSSKKDPNDQIGVLAIEIMPISSRICHHALSRQEMCDEISAIISHHFPDQKFVLASHSYGTVVSTHLLKSPLASQIGPMFLMDPVCILLHLPDVAYNFTRRKPKRANEYQLYYFASMDMGVAHTLGRCFFWNENMLWKKDVVRRKITISLGGRDIIVNSEAVRRYWSAPVKGYEKTLMPKDYANGSVKDAVLVDLDEVGGSEELRTNEEAVMNHGDGDESEYEEWRGSGTEVVWFDDLDHAQVFDNTSTRQNVIRKIQKYCEDG